MSTATDQERISRRRRNFRLGWVIGIVVVLWYLFAMLWYLPR